MIYKGILNVDEYCCLQCGDIYLIEDLQKIFKSGNTVFIRYYITDIEVTEEESKEALILKTIGGNLDDLSFILEAYSEYTIIDYEEILIVDGHDLYTELRTHEGKFLTFIIDDVIELRIKKLDSL